MFQNLSDNPWDGYFVTFCLCFCFEKSSYPTKYITLTHKHGDVKTPARRFFDQRNFDARGKDKIP